MTHVSAFTAITKHALPQVTTPQGSYEPVRYSLDQVPIGLHPDARSMVVCLLTQDAAARIADLPRTAPHVARRPANVDAARRHPCPHGRLRETSSRGGKAGRGSA